MELLLALVVGFVVSAVAGRLTIPMLRRLKVGQSIKEDGPTWHMGKQGTPTMGGIMFIIGVAVAILVCGWNEMMMGNRTHLYLLLLALVYGVIGFVDDFAKVVKHQNEGLTALQKLLLQLAASAGFLFILKAEGLLTNELYVPFFQVKWTIPWAVYLVLAVFVIVGTVNAVNITDGIDGLCASVSVPVCVFFTMCAVIWAGYTAQGIFAAALCGALVGFLLYNFHPAKVFMGDTGSLFIGGAIAALAFSYDMPLVLLPVGIVYVIETVSDIIQVGYFKLSHGKRVFKMAPIHHHLEKCGWGEIKITLVFTMISTIFCMLASLGVLNR